MYTHELDDLVFECGLSQEYTTARNIGMDHYQKNMVPYNNKNIDIPSSILNRQH